ncbi:UNVERIFIED_CONTAM: hypothetical protein HDU68_009675 [Siphonaria sp. JEL0065]|nr:hypothetical protein HDU68_009675 [Siphonaria sp. JEL0065]
MENMCRFGVPCLLKDLEETCRLASTSPVRGQPRSIGMYLSDGEGGRITFYASGNDPVDGTFIENETVPFGVFSRWKLNESAPEFECTKVERVEVSGMAACKELWKREFGVEV